jgi:hypothetical protein
MFKSLGLILAVTLPVILMMAVPCVRESIGKFVDEYAFKMGFVMYIMTPGQARVIDPILTTAAQGYKNAEFVGNKLFPVVPVDQRGGKIIQFGKEDFLLYNTGRAPGGATKRVNYGYQGAPYALEQHSLEGQVPFELQQDANQVPGIDLGKMAVNKTQNIIGLRLEKAQADLATNPANYAASNKQVLAGTDMWDNPASKPATLIQYAIETVRSKIGKRPNTVEIGASVFKSLKTHPEVIDRIKYTGRDVVTKELLAALWDVKEVVVGDAVYADDQGNFYDIWGRSVVVAFTEVGSVPDAGLPSYGYTYQLRNFPIVEEPYMDRNAKSWIYPVTDEVQPVIAGALGGFLFTNVVTAPA